MAGHGPDERRIQSSAPARPGDSARHRTARLDRLQYGRMARRPRRDKWFDEAYIGWGGEDSDIGSRLYHLGRPRKFVYGRAIVYHLNHPPLSREKFQNNTAKLEETLRSRRIRCEQGLSQHA